MAAILVILVTALVHIDTMALQSVDVDKCTFPNENIIIARLETSLSEGFHFYVTDRILPPTDRLFRFFRDGSIILCSVSMIVM